MKNFGKLVGFPETISETTVIGRKPVLDNDDNIVGWEDVTETRNARIAVFRDRNGRDWHDLFAQFPHAWYIAVDPDGLIVSAERDAEQSQIGFIPQPEFADDPYEQPGLEIWGIDDINGYTNGPTGTVYGKLWTGSAIVERPLTLQEQYPPLTMRQFKKQLSREGLLAAVEVAITEMTGQEGEEAQIEWTTASQFERDHPLVITLPPALGLSEEQVNEMWLKALQL